MSAHIGDDAALYALGMLDEREMATIDQHVETCEACTILLAQAHDDLAAIAASQPQHELEATPLRRPIRGYAPLAALAAALVIAVLPSSYFYMRMNAMHREMVAESQMMTRMMDATHRSVAFTHSNASVMYSPDGSWYVIVVRNAKQALSVAWMHDGEQTMLGTTEQHGDVAVLYLPASHRMDQLALLAGGQVVGQARLAF